MDALMGGVISKLVRLLVFYKYSSFESSFRLARFSHSISTPLSVLSLSLPDSGNTLTPSKCSRMKVALRQINLLLSDLKNPRKERFCVVSTVREVVGLFNDRRVRVLHDTEYVFDQSTQVYGCKSELMEVVSCLVENGLQSYADLESGFVVILLSVEQADIVLSISDFGKGMSFIEKILVPLPLMTLKKRGSGIGLTYSKKIVEKHFLGSMRLVSYEGVGTTVQVRLPRANQASQSRSTI